LSNSVALPVTDLSQVGEARRAASTLARRLGFNETECGKVALVATEAASNLVKHAREGFFLAQSIEQDSSVGIELIALDKGPGMADIRRCLEDGYSTAGTPGTGLGAIARMSYSWDAYSTASNGTALLARHWLGGSRDGKAAILSVAGVGVPMRGESTCGDSWGSVEENGRSLIVVADGLGHGPDAALASREAVRIFRQNTDRSPAIILQELHRGLRSTRGAAIAVAEVIPAAGTVLFAGVGNIAGIVLDGASARAMVSHNGTVGHEARKFQEFSYSFPRNATLVMHSDGIVTRWSLDGYPGLLVRDPALVAAVLYRDFQRGRDDATVVVARSAEGARA
jgi:anti-sigma regulatory factor (Ser/Thr protein kinase)